MAMMAHMDNAMDRPVPTSGAVGDLMVHIVVIMFAYFGWVPEKLELEESFSTLIPGGAKPSPLPIGLVKGEVPDPALLSGYKS